jgi:cubilin
VPAPIKSFGNELYLKFKSDTMNSGKGFEIEWDGISTGCGGVLTSTKGSITSPNYPISYAHNAHCEWRISVSKGSSISILIAEIEMEE